MFGLPENTENMRNAIRDAICQLRLPAMTVEEFARHCARSSLLLAEESRDLYSFIVLRGNGNSLSLNFCSRQRQFQDIKGIFVEEANQGPALGLMSMGMLSTCSPGVNVSINITANQNFYLFGILLKSCCRQPEMRISEVVAKPINSNHAHQTGFSVKEENTIPSGHQHNVLAKVWCLLCIIVFYSTTHNMETRK